MTTQTMCSGDRVAVRLWHHYSGWGSASSAKIQGDQTRKPDWANVPLSALKLLAIESWSLRKANLRVSGLCYRAGATHGLPCTEVILCVVVCVLGLCHCFVPAVNSAIAGAVICGNCCEKCAVTASVTFTTNVSLGTTIRCSWMTV